MKQVGFIGLGMMGWPMALNVARAGFPLTVYDADPERAAAFGGEVEAVAGGGPEAVRYICRRGDDASRRRRRAAAPSTGRAPSGRAAAGSVVVDMSTSNPKGTGLARRVAERGGRRCPVSGGIARRGRAR